MKRTQSRSGKLAIAIAALHALGACIGREPPESICSNGEIHSYEKAINEIGKFKVTARECLANGRWESSVCEQAQKDNDSYYGSFGACLIEFVESGKTIEGEWHLHREFLIQALKYQALSDSLYAEMSEPIE